MSDHNSDQQIQIFDPGNSIDNGFIQIQCSIDLDSPSVEKLSKQASEINKKQEIVKSKVQLIQKEHKLQQNNNQNDQEVQHTFGDLNISQQSSEINFSKLNLSNQVIIKKSSLSLDEMMGQVVKPQPSKIKYPVEETSIFNKPEIIIDMNRSRFTSKETNSVRNANQEQCIRNQKIDQNVQQSVYLKKYDPNESIKIDQNVKNSISLPQTKGVTIKKRDRRYYFEFQKVELQISNSLMCQMMRQFYDLRILIPFFNENLYLHEFESRLNSSGRSNELSTYLEKYIEFLNNRHSSELQSVLNQLKKNDGKQMKKIKKQQSFLQQLATNFWKNTYSKAQLLKNTIQSKLKCRQMMNQFTTRKKLSFSLNNQRQIQHYQNLLGSLNLLISFQKAQQYCDVQLKNSSEQKIWNSYRNQLRKDRNWWITNYFSKLAV